MSGSALSAVIRRVGAESGEPDAALLARFIAANDSSAFAELVRRYSRLVWTVCRHSLPCDADADDAFQATFLALVRHASSVRSAHRLGPWLHTVAVRVCRNARRAAARRARREATVAIPEQTHSIAESAWEMAAAVVHDEVAKLPAAHRMAFVLCVVEGKTPTAAAAQLGVPVGTVGSHLHRAKERLIKQLAARGIGASVAMATLNGAPPASAVERAVCVAQSPPAVVISLLSGAVPMSLPHAKLLLVLATLAVGFTGLLLPISAQNPPKADAKAIPPKAEAKARLDLYGDPLPEKALMRLGTTKYRLPGIAGFGFKASGELVVVDSRSNVNTFPADGGPEPVVAPCPQEWRQQPGSGVWYVSADARFVIRDEWNEGARAYRLAVWDISGPKPVEHLHRDFLGVSRVAFSSDGHWLAVHNRDREDPANLLIADLTTKKWKVLPVSGIESVERLTFTPDGKRLAVGYDRKVMVFDTDSTELLLNLSLPGVSVQGIALSPDGKTVAVLPSSTGLTGDEKEIRLLSVADGKPVEGWAVPKVQASNLGFAPDGKTLWVLGDTRLREWDPATDRWSREATVPPDRGLSPGPQWSPDGKRFVVHNHTTIVWFDAKTWKPLHPTVFTAGPTAGVAGITVSPDGKTIATDGDEVHLWDASTGQLLRRVNARADNRPTLAFLPDSKSFFAIVDWQSLVECEARTGKELRRLRLPDDLVNRVYHRDLRISADGKTLDTLGDALSSDWRSLRLRWDVAKGEVSGRAAATERNRYWEEVPEVTSPDGAWRAVHGTVNRADGSVQPIELFPDDEGRWYRTSWSADSKRVALPRLVGKTFAEQQKDTNASVVVFDLVKNDRVAELPAGPVDATALSDDGQLLATMTRTRLVVWNVATKKEVFGMTHDEGLRIHYRGLAFTSDGKRLIAAYGTHCLVWDLSEATATATAK